jgi:hypothetical protein
MYVHRRFGERTSVIFTAKRRQPAESYIAAGCLLGLLFDREDGSSAFFERSMKFYWRICHHIPEDTAVRT